MSSKLHILLGWLVLPAFVSAQPSPGTAVQPESVADPSYRLNFGDRLSVAVFGEPDLSVQQLIDRSGKIRLPLIGDLTVAGSTSRQAEALIEDSYRREQMLKAPQVTVAMVAYAPREVMVLGAVRAPGAFQFPPDVVSLDIRDVIARQGGLTPVARGDAVAVTRRQPDGVENTTTVNIDRMMYSRSKKRTTEPAVMIYPGDRIFIPERLF